MDTFHASRCHVESLVAAALDSSIASGDWLAAEHILRAIEGLSRDGVIGSPCLDRAYLAFAKATKARSGKCDG